MKGLFMANEFESEHSEPALLGDVPELNDDFWNGLLDGAYEAPAGAADDLVDTYESGDDASFDETLDDTGHVDDGINTDVIDDDAASALAGDVHDDQDAAGYDGDDKTDGVAPAQDANLASTEGDFEGISDPFAIIDQVIEPVTDVDGTDQSAGTTPDTLDADEPFDTVDAPALDDDTEFMSAEDHRLDSIDSELGVTDSADDLADADGIDDADGLGDLTDFGNF